MIKLEYTFKTDTLFKMLFVKYPDLLKRLVAELLGINYDSIEQFIITNPEMSPENMGDKFCKLDINMTIDSKRVDLEVQVNDEGDYPDRSLFYWAREYSSAIGEGDDYSLLPRTIIISIVDFVLFNCTEFQSEYQPLEINRHTPLTDKMSLYYYELPKLPALVNVEYGKELWLNLFNAETEEELTKIEALEVPVLKQAIKAFRYVSASPEFREIERLRSKARHDEAQALKNARLEEQKKWESVIADKDALITELRAQLDSKQ